MAKITDLLKNKSDKKFSYSFEVTPDIKESELDSLTVEPAFFSVTWHAKSHQNKDLDIPPLKVAKFLRSKNKNVLLHITCVLLRKEYLSNLLKMLQEHSIRNLFVILGENYEPEMSDFKTSDELIKAIRSETGDYFCIGVAGMPDCSDEKLEILKNRTDVGANFILTQAFFESNVYCTFVERCKNYEIDVPIVPGMFYFQTFKEFKGFTNLCKIKVSKELSDSIQNESGITPGENSTRQLIETLKHHEVFHFHFFTLNKLDSVITFVKQF